MTRFVVSLALVAALAGCTNFVIREDDSAMAVAGKVTGRAFGCVATIWMACWSELGIMPVAKQELENAVYPVTSGSHVLLAAEEQLAKMKHRYVIWSNHPIAVGELTAIVQARGHQVVERARLQQVFEEQAVRLVHTPDKEADILRVGKLLGADRVIFADAILDGSQYTGYRVSVTARNVNVENGEIRWSGSASFNRPIRDPEASLSRLVQFAVGHALCPTENGRQWVEAGPWRKSWGCLENR